MEVNEEILIMQIDTGAAETIISKETYKKVSKTTADRVCTKACHLYNSENTGMQRRLGKGLAGKAGKAL